MAPVMPGYSAAVVVATLVVRFCADVAVAVPVPPPPTVQAAKAALAAKAAVRATMPPTTLRRRRLGRAGASGGLVLMIWGLPQCRWMRCALRRTGRGTSAPPVALDPRQADALS